MAKTHLKDLCDPDILLKSELRGFKWKIKKYGKYSTLQRWYCSLDDAAKLVPHIEMEDKNSEGAGSWQQCECIMFVCVSG